MQQAMNETTSGWGKFGYGVINPFYYVPLFGWGAKAGRVIGGVAKGAMVGGKAAQAATGLSRLSPTLGSAVVKGTALPYAGEQLLGKAIGKTVSAVALKNPISYAIGKGVAKWTAGDKELYNSMLKKAGANYAITHEISEDMGHEVIKRFVKPSTTLLAFRRKVAGLPVIGRPSKFIENINDTRTLVQDDLMMDIMAENAIANIRSKNTVNIFNRLNHLGDAKKVWGLTDVLTNKVAAMENALARNVTLAPEADIAKTSRFIGDVLEDWTNTSKYVLTDQQKAWAQEFTNIISEAKDRAIKNGLDLEKYGDDFWYFRHGLGKVDYNTGEVSYFGRSAKPGGPRVHDTMMQAVYGPEGKGGLGFEGGQIYNWNPIDSAQHVDAWVNKNILEENLKKYVKPYGDTYSQAAMKRMDGVYKQTIQQTNRLRNLNNKLTRIFVGSGTEKQTYNSSQLYDRAKLALNEDDIAIIKELGGDDLTKALGLSDEAGSITFDETVASLNKAKVEILDQYKKQVEALRELTPKYRNYVNEYKSGYFNPTTQNIIKSPMFGGRVFPKQVAESYRMGMGLPGKRAESWMGTIQKSANASKVLRTLIASMDFSAPFIQGLPAFGSNPMAWAKTTLRHYRWFFDKGNFSDWMMQPKNVAAWNEAKNSGLQLGTFEYYAGEKAIEQLGSKVPIIGKQVREAARQTLGRGEVAFSAFGDAQRLELWKSMSYRATTDAQKAELAQAINKMTGFTEVVTSNAESLLEQALIFAPRYTRAGFQLVGDIFAGGLKGELARESLGHMMAGGAIWYMQICKALGVEPNLDPTSSKFLSVKIGDQWIGIGGFMTSLVRFGGNLYAYEEKARTGEGSITQRLGFAQQEGETQQEYLTRLRIDNPFLKFMYSKSAPFVGAAAEAGTGFDYFGKEIEGIEGWAKWASDKLIPMAFQPLTQGDTAPLGLAAQIAGLREFPVSAKEKFYDEIAKLTGVQWKNLDKMQRRSLLLEHPELDEMQSEANKAFAIGVSGRINQEWTDQSDRIEAQYDTKLQNIAATYEAGGYSAKQFRDAVGEAGANRRAAYDLMKNDSKFAGIYAAFDDPGRVNADNVFDVALFNFRQMMWDNPDLYDKNGNFLYSEYDKNKNDFIGTWGQGTYDQIQQYVELGRMGEPEAIADLHKAQQTMSPYFGIKDHLLAQAGLTGTYEAYNTWVNQHPLSETKDQNYLKDMLGLTPVLEQISNYQKQIRESNGGQNPYNYYYMKYYS
jgi:hypothetical protein